MPGRNTKFYSLILIIIDTLVLLGAFTIAYIARVQYDPRPLIANIHAYDYLQTFILIIPFWIVVFASLGLYQANVYNRRILQWSKIAIGSFIGILIVIGWEYVSGKNIFPARLVAVYSLVAAFGLIVIERELFQLVRKFLFRHDRGITRVLLIGTSDATSEIARSLAETEKSGYKIIAIAGPKKNIPEGLKVISYSLIEAALLNIKADRINAIIQTDLYDSSERNQKVLSAAQTNHLNYSFIPGETEFYSGKNTIDVFLGYPMISVYQTPLIGWGAIAKRIFDLFAVLIASPIWLPIILIVFIAQKIVNPGPAFFLNTRLARYGKKIDLYKFRSMTPKYCGQDAITIFKNMGREDLAQEYIKTRKVENDPRITRFGHFIRATSLDEIPQIFNVIKGDMSLVGPRPILPDEKGFYKNRGSLLFSVKPGITGLWQVSGRNETSFEGRVDLELFYAQNWTFWLDIKILFKTIGVVIKKTGAK